MTYEEFKKLQYKAENKEGNLLTEEELNILKPYKVDNAIIMAAGYSARCMPLSNVLPKGLFRVKGEILIEREIRQLQEAGVKEIIIVTGFMQEKFQYIFFISGANNRITNFSCYKTSKIKHRL